jgi:hypothetical protein
MSGYFETPFEFLSEDEERCLQAFKQYGVKFVVVGGYAVRTHGHLRTTEDLDLLMDLSPTNLQNLESALGSLGVKNSQEVVELFATKPNPKWRWADGNADHYVDLLGVVEFLKFDDVLTTAVEVQHNEFCMLVISKPQLIDIKERGLARGSRGDKAQQDREDLAALKAK